MKDPNKKLKEVLAIIILMLLLLLVGLFCNLISKIERYTLNKTSENYNCCDIKKVNYALYQDSQLLPIREQAEIICKATWYGDFFHNRLTANGEVYDQWGMTAASNVLPFGTVIRVTNMANGKSVDVRITDRGGFSHCLDLSRGAF